MTTQAQEAGMTPDEKTRFGRRDLLRKGALFSVIAGSGAVAGREFVAAAVGPNNALFQLPDSDAVDFVTIPSVRLMATDGHFSLPGRRHAGKPLFGFGFRAVDDPTLVTTGGELNANPGALIGKYKGLVHSTAPTIVVMEGQEMAIVVTNLGLAGRPDLDDSHSLHWHGFRNATAVFDGVPETSIAVPPGRDLPYFFDPKTADQPGQAKGSAGSYMYHCHFEDTEHVQMGMTGIIFVEPRDMWFESDGSTPRGTRLKVAYNTAALDDPAVVTPTGPVSSLFDREFALLVNEIDTVPHDNLEDIQEFVWSDYDPKYWTINGRSYPDTVVPQIISTEESLSAGAPTELMAMPASPASGDETAESEMLWQHNSSLIQAREGDKVLLRIANLGYEIHSIELSGANDLRVIAHDASLLIGKNGTSDLSYLSRRIELGPGEARDAIFTVPAYDDSTAEVDTVAGRADTPRTRRFNRYLLKSRNSDRMSNDGTLFPGDGPSYAGAQATYGGMVTELWVYPTIAAAPGLGQDGLPDQAAVNETFPTLVVPAGHV